MPLVGIGPVAFGPFDHGNPTYSRGASGSSRGRPTTLGGLMPWVKADQLLEILDDGPRTTWRGVQGVSEYFEFTGILASWTGWYHITDFRTDPNKSHTMDPEGAPFTLTAIYRGPVES